MDKQKVLAEAKGVKWGTLWWTLSIVAHGLAVFCLVYFTPLREWFMRPPDPNEALASMGTTSVRKQVAWMLEVATRRLREIVDQQRRVLGDLEAIRDGRYRRYEGATRDLLARGTRVPAIEPISTLGTVDPVLRSSMDRLDFIAVYEVAKGADRATYATYRQIRSIEMARIMSMGLRDAFQTTTLERDRPLPREIKTHVLRGRIESALDPKLQALRVELEETIQEASAMLSAALRMKDLSEELVADDVGGTLALTPGPLGSGATAGDGGRVRPTPFEGYSPPDPSAWEHPWGVGIGPVTHKYELFPRDKGLNLPADARLPGGRRIVSHGVLPTAWMYINTWYGIGPFPNPNRERLDEKYPPEAGGTDLDAVYRYSPSLYGSQPPRVLDYLRTHPLRWEYRQSPEPCVAPRLPIDYGIWYAYTEIYADEDQWRYCLFGSDDFGKAWVNDEEVYRSGTTPHPWAPDRGTRRVHFKKGYNRVLFKLENAWGRTGYSMCIFLGDKL